MSPGQRLLRPWQSWKVRVTLLSLLLVLGTFAEAIHTFRSGQAIPFSCWILPDASVSFVASLDPSCPLSPYERIRYLERGEEQIRIYSRQDLREAVSPGVERIRVTTMHRGTERTVYLGVFQIPPGTLFSYVSVFVLFALALTTLGLFILWSSASGAAKPVALLCALASSCLIAGSFRSSIGSLDSTWIVAQTLIPTVILHIALAAPIQSSILDRVRGMAPFIYSVAGIALAIQALSIHRTGEVWRLVEFVVVSVGVAAGIAVTLCCLSGIRHASTDRARTHASVLLLLILVILAIGVVLPIGFSTPLIASSSRPFTLLLLALLFVSIYLACRYAVVDIPRAARWVVSYGLYTTVVALAFAFIASAVHRGWDWTFVLGDPVLLFAGSFVTLLALDQIRRLSLVLVDRWWLPTTAKLDQVRAAHAREIGGAKDADAAAAHLVASIVDGLEAKGVSVFFPVHGNRWRLAYADGGAPLEQDLAACAYEILQSNPKNPPARLGVSSRVARLERVEKETAAKAELLRFYGTEAICALRAGDGTTYAIVLITALNRNSLFSSEQLQFLEDICTATTLAMRSAYLHEQLMAADRVAAIGHAAAGLAHDLGRPIGEVFVEVNSLRESAASQEQVSSSLATIETLTSECLTHLEGFARSLEDERETDPGHARLSFVIEAAADRIARLNDGRRPALWLSSDNPLIPDGRNLQRVFENLLENAFHWTDESHSVEVFAATAEVEAIVRIVDEGRGMSSLECQRALEPFFSGRDGTGLGLAICRDIIGGLGGKIQIESNKGVGTEVTLHIPLVEASA